MNKLGTDKILSIYWFAILFIVAAGIVYMVVVVYGDPYDVREIEANLLANQVADCISEAGRLKEKVYDGNFLLTQENFLENCRLNFNVEDFEDWKTQGQYYVEVGIYDFGGAETDFLGAGNVNLKDFCEMKGKNFPFCLERSFYALDKDEKQHTIKILSVIGKIEKNVR